jgi:hypothetical protein
MFDDTSIMVPTPEQVEGKAESESGRVKVGDQKSMARYSFDYHAPSAACLLVTVNLVALGANDV